jgi:arabinogalactan endo-1,4-beta-galactosidase
MGKNGILSMALSVAVALTSASFGRTQPFILGADVSWIPEEEARGVKYFDGGMQKDIFQILKDHKFNCVRLRIFHNPAAPSGGSVATTGAVYSGYSSQGFCDLAHTKAMALRIKAAGMMFSLDFHYSDNWADPGKQYKPHAWANATFTELTDSVRQYTKNVITELKNQGTPPHMVQVGNEITAGMIWPDGRTNNWTNLGTLLKAGIAGVKDVDSTIKTIMHIDKGGDNAATRSWVDNAIKQGVVFDILGESCYTTWQGPPSGWQSNFTDLVTRYPDYSFIIAEYSQEKRAANDVMFNLPDGRGLGTFIWEPLQYLEAFFTASGNNWSTNSYIDLYPQMSKDYGNDTFTASGKRSIPAGRQSGYSVVNPAAWLAGHTSLQVYCPAESGMRLDLYAVNGTIMMTMTKNGHKGINQVGDRREVRGLARGCYILSLKIKGIMAVQYAVVK